MSARYFFDLPVYRLTEGKYQTEFRAYESKELSNFPPSFPVSQEYKDHLFDAYGGCWRYNEIVGYIRLHFLCTQIRGSYYAVKRSRLVLTRKKTLKYCTWKLAPEVTVPTDSDDYELFLAIMKYVAGCRRLLKQRYIDATLLEVIGPHVRWNQLYSALKHA